ncbi:hypothetical protein CTI12_AA429610 [Artemisia annua]|uniref:Uncharacterized protein n=1 Tax=Artemisia annua TaxID=35608 RepID=A0A2U1M1K7_ARTAN|nr:hypothetical protein CTI12_AA429610 [Artemisia annua]
MNVGTDDDFFTFLGDDENIVCDKFLGDDENIVCDKDAFSQVFKVFGSLSFKS